MNDFWNMAWLILAGLLPFLGFLVVCFVVMRAVFNVDRNERKAVAQWDKSHTAETTPQGTASNGTASKASNSASTQTRPAGQEEPRPTPDRGRGREGQ